MSEFVPEEILRILNKHEVRYVLIGGLAATFYGSVTPTFDVDITPEMTMVNLARLSAALTELDARIRVEGVPDGLPFSHDATSLLAGKTPPAPSSGHPAAKPAATRTVTGARSTIAAPIRSPSSTRPAHSPSPATRRASSSARRSGAAYARAALPGALEQIEQANGDRTRTARRETRLRVLAAVRPRSWWVRWSWSARQVWPTPARPALVVRVSSLELA